MQISQMTGEKDTGSIGVQMSTCPHGTASGYFCSASIMTVVLSNYQKTTYCWTDNYDCCPLFLAKVLRER
jgi:hypothetical protein